MAFFSLFKSPLLPRCGNEGTLQEDRKVYEDRRDVLTEGLQRAGWPVEPPKGSMFLWSRIPASLRRWAYSTSRNC